MQAKYTPGPWEEYAAMIVKFGVGGRNICEISATNDDGMVRHVKPTYVNISDPELQANMRLIAAAPDMAEALNGLLASVDVQRLYGIGLLKTEWKRGMDALQKAGL